MTSYPDPEEMAPLQGVSHITSPYSRPTSSHRGNGYSAHDASEKTNYPDPEEMAPSPSVSHVATPYSRPTSSHSARIYGDYEGDEMESESESSGNEGILMDDLDHLVEQLRPEVRAPMDDSQEDHDFEARQSDEALV
jgi:hypothetical protein